MIMGNFSNSILPQPNDSYSTNTIQMTSDDQYLSADIGYAYRLLNCSDYECFTPSSISITSASSPNGGTSASGTTITSVSSTNGGSSISTSVRPTTSSTGSPTPSSSSAQVQGK